MVVTCGDCGASFRLDLALMKEAKGIRVRCRRCGGKIVVLRPEVAEAPLLVSADEVVPIDTGIPSAELKGGTSPAPDEGTAVGADLPAVDLPAPAPSPSGELTVRLSPFPVLDRQKAVAGKDTAVPQPMPKADADLPTAPEASGPSEEIVPLGPERAVFPGGRSHTLKYILVAGLAILLLAGGTLYYRTAKPGGERLGKVVPAYDIRDVKWSFEKKTASGTLFVVKGKVANLGKGASGGIRIQVTLLGKDNEALAEKAAFAGNPLDVASLRRMDRPAIEGAMSNRFGEGNVNREIPSGKILPFMVLFIDPPVEVDAIMVKAIDAR